MTSASHPFGGKTPEKCGILLNGSKLEWVAKLTYLGCHFVTLLAPHAKSTSVLILGNLMEVLTIFYDFIRVGKKTEMKSLVFTLSSLTVCLR